MGCASSIVGGVYSDETEKDEVMEALRKIDKSAFTRFRGHSDANHRRHATPRGGRGTRKKRDSTKETSGRADIHKGRARADSTRGRERADSTKGNNTKRGKRPARSKETDDVPLSSRYGSWVLSTGLT